MHTMSYLLIGTITADIVADGRILGGTVSYAAPVVDLFGHDIRILSSADPHDSLLNPLFDLAETKIVPAEHTTTFSNIYRPTGRQQIIHQTAKNLEPSMLPEQWKNSNLVHLAPLADDVDYGFANQFPNAKVLLTPQGYMRRWGADGIVHFKEFLDKDVLQAIDILVLSKQDILAAPELENEFPKYADHVVVTDGENGGTYYHNGDNMHYDAFPATEIDPTGAGDVFAASLLASLPLVNFDMSSALIVAARLAALAVTVKGSKISLSSTNIQTMIQEALDKND